MRLSDWVYWGVIAAHATVFATLTMDYVFKLKIAPKQLPASLIEQLCYKSVFCHPRDPISIASAECVNAWYQDDLSRQGKWALVVTILKRRRYKKARQFGGPFSSLFLWRAAEEFGHFLFQRIERVALFGLFASGLLLGLRSGRRDLRRVG